MPTYYWISTTPGANASDFAQWSNAGPGGAPLGAWPGSSPDASDDFFFDDQSTADCTWDIAAVQSIRQDTTNLYTGVITFATNVALKGLILNGEITDGGTGYALTFSGTPLTALDDASSKSRYVLNGQKAKHGSGSTLLYKIQPSSTDVHLDNGPYNKLTIDTNTMTLAYNVPTATTHDNADDGTIHIKSDFVATAGGGFLRDTAPDASEDTAVKIKFDTTNFTYTNATLDFVMATAFFRGIEIPTTGAQTYGSSTVGFTTKHYGLVVFATSDGELSTIPNGLQLDCYSLEIKAGARLRVQSGSGIPAIIKSQTQPKVKGVWSFESLNSHTFTSPRSNPVSSVANGGTGLSSVEANALLMGNSSTPMRPLVELAPGTNGYVLTMVGGTPAWAAASGGGGGAVDSVFGRTGTVVATEGDYDLDELGDVDVTSAAETQILRHDGTSFVNDYNDIMFLRVKAREAINKGEAIYIFDAHNSNVVGVKKARADSASTMPCIGVAYETLALGDEGLAVSFGKANGIAANFTEGETMYVSPTTAGALTNTKPTGNTQLIQNVGILMQAHVSNAVVKVTGIGRSNDVPNQFSVGGSITAGSFVKSGGASTEFLKADGSVDTNTYITTAYTDADAIAAVEGTSSLDLTGDLTMDTTKKVVMDEKTYATSSAASGTIELSSEKTGSNSPLLTLRTPSGYLRMGPQNTSFCHFYTDRDYFYFNRAIQMDGGSFYAYNDDLLIKTDDSGSGQPTRIFIDAGVDPCRVGIGNGFTSSNLPATELEVAGTIRQSNVASAVLVADANGDIVAATTLLDQTYLAPGQAETDAFNPIASAPNWLAPAPTNIQQAIDRLAAYVVTIPGAPPQIP